MGTTCVDTPKGVTPMMAQWNRCKSASKGSLLFFRMGDFYEAFYDDAVVMARELELTLTKRQSIPMAGVPHHTVDTYIDRLVSKGHRVAIAEQTEDPRKAKGLVRREIVRHVTPGTVVNSSLLSDKSNNFFASLVSLGHHYGLAFLDLTTAEFMVIEFNDERTLLNELYRLRPAEILVSEGMKKQHIEIFDDMKTSYTVMVTTQEDWMFDHHHAYEFLTSHFSVHNLDGFGLKGVSSGVTAAGVLLRHLSESLSLPVDHITKIRPYSTDECMVLDRITQRNLELTESLSDGSKKNTLLDVLDRTSTPMGGRLMRHWVKQPLLSVKKIRKRHDAVEALTAAPLLLMELVDALDKVRDIERLMTKISANYATARDIVSLRLSLEQIPRVKEMLSSATSTDTLVEHHMNKLSNIGHIISRIAAALVDEPPARLSDGGYIRKDYCAVLDRLYDIRKNSKEWLAQYQARLRKETGIKTLKVGYTKVFGYYIDVSKGQAENMPDTFQRRQTLVNNERFISPELKEYEHTVLTAEEKISALESELFSALREEVAAHSATIFSIAQAIAHIDVLASLARVARDNRYAKPTVDNSQQCSITMGRHPIIEMSLMSEQFIPNDTSMDSTDNRLLIITGPNMAGKSTYIRQVALIAIMAQMGSFVPAKEAHIGIIDKVFSRIGANDDLSRGQSTFMVEMTETANILNNATSRSLVILDEIGRGTSTYDGISLAWAVAEYLLIYPEKQAKTLFATHYWELTEMEHKFPGCVNHSIAVQECDDTIVFLRKIVRGSTNKSYGIHVARLAGLPNDVIHRAKEILSHLENDPDRTKTFDHSEQTKMVPATAVKSSNNEVQLLLFEPEKNYNDSVASDLKKLDINNFTPLQALQKLEELQRKSLKK